MRRALLQVSVCMLWATGIAAVLLALVFPAASGPLSLAVQVAAYVVTVAPLVLLVRPRPALLLGAVRWALPTGAVLVVVAVVVDVLAGVRVEEGLVRAVTAVSAGVGEEVLFRGVLREPVRVLVRSRVGACVADSVLFAVYHLPVVTLRHEPVWTLATVLLVGAVLSVLRTVSGGLLLPAAVHVAIDLSG